MQKAGILVTVALLASSCFGASVADVRQSTHHTVQNTIASNASCSATAIGPQALLTASHCEEPTDELTVDDTTVDIVKRIRDGHDHTIYLINGKPFENWTRVALVNNLQPGEHIYYFGNPDDLTGMYREGYFTGTDKNDDKDFPFDIYYFDTNVWHGDSGAGIFNQDGTLVTVVSFIRGGTNRIHLEGSFALAFKSEQIDEARAFKTPVVVHRSPDMKGLFSFGVK